jgi:hypothetical protein
MSDIKHVYKLWVRVEVHNRETDEHEDLDPEVCEYKIKTCTDLEDVADFISVNSFETKDEILNELTNAMEEISI